MADPTSDERPGTATRPSAGGRLLGIDGLRAISIAFVLVGHGADTLPEGTVPEAILPYLGNGHLGVTTFFVVSGYLITYLLLRERRRTGAVGLSDFYIRRVLRIFPAFYTYLAAMAIARSWGWIDTTVADLAAAGTFTVNYNHLTPGPTNGDYWFVGHFWTLALEEQFYLLWPLAFLLAGPAKAHRVALAIVVTAPAVRTISYFLDPGSRGQLGIMLHTAADPIMFGCCAALWQGRRGFEATLDRLSFWTWSATATAFLVLISPACSIRWGGAYSMTCGRSLEAIAIAFLLLQIVRRPDWLVTRALSNRILCHIGVLSYSLYLWQQPFLTPRNTSWSGTFPLNLLLCLIAAELSHWVVERPFLRLRGRFRPALDTRNSGREADAT